MRNGNLKYKSSTLDRFENSKNFNKGKTGMQEEPDDLYHLNKIFDKIVTYKIIN